MAKKELKTEYKIVITHGSDFQDELSEDLVGATIMALKIAIEGRHKKNKFNYLMRKIR